MNHINAPKVVSAEDKSLIEDYLSKNDVTQLPPNKAGGAKLDPYTNESLRAARKAFKEGTSS